MVEVGTLRSRVLLTGSAEPFNQGFWSEYDNYCRSGDRPVPQDNAGKLYAERRGGERDGQAVKLPSSSTGLPASS